MSEKRTLSRWLRSEEVYRESASEVNDAENSQWRDALLLEFDPQTAKPIARRVAEPEGQIRIQAHHLIWFAVAGVALFLMGWMFGSQIISIEKISNVSPWIWVGGSFVGSMGFLYWNRLRSKRRPM